LYTYFVITPGVELYSYVQYTDKKQGNYIKFGDSNSPHEDSEGIRKAYMTHNPDIGVAAVMDSTAITNPNLGTVLKNQIKALGYPIVGTSEWFSVDTKNAWDLFIVINNKWNNKVVDANNLAKLQADINKALTG
jgi:hypothetical protein